VLAVRTGETLLREAEGAGTAIGMDHFPGVRFQRILRGSERRSWTPSG
jgi:hypothetical protein